MVRISFLYKPREPYSLDWTKLGDMYYFSNLGLIFNGVDVSYRGISHLKNSLFHTGHDLYSYAFLPMVALQSTVGILCVYISGVYFTVHFLF